MKQKSSRGLTEKTENGSNRNAPAHRENVLCPKAAVVAGVEPRRVREIGVYQEYQRVLPRRWVVDLGVGEHHVDGDTFSGGRRLG